MLKILGAAITENSRPGDPGDSGDPGDPGDQVLPIPRFEVHEFVKKDQDTQNYNFACCFVWV
jgi:hypothetical protein